MYSKANWLPYGDSRIVGNLGNYVLPGQLTNNSPLHRRKSRITLWNQSALEMDFHIHGWTAGQWELKIPPWQGFERNRLQQGVRGQTLAPQ